MEMEAALIDLLKGLIVSATTVAKKLVVAGVVLLIGYLLIKWAMKLIERSPFAKKSDPTAVRVINNFIRVGLYVVLLITVIGILGVPMASIVAAIASAGVAIGLALQGALSNLAGGIMILIFRPFRIGDYVETADEAGTVEDIGIFYTVLKTPDNKVVTLPNGTVMASNVTNYSLKDTRRVEFVFHAAYGTDVERIKSLLLEEAGKHERVLHDPEPFARLAEQGDHGLVFKLRVWTANEDYWTVHFDLLEAINARFEKESIEVPFNQLDVHITK